MNQNTSIAAPVALLAAASGARSMTGVAAVAQARAAAESASEPRGAIPRIVSQFDHQIATAATALAGFEYMADKAPNIPDRVNPGPLLARVAAGAVVGAAIAGMSGGDRRSAAIEGAVVAFAAAHLSYRLRAVLADHLPRLVAGVAEDALVLGIAAAGMTLLPGRAGGRS